MNFKLIFLIWLLANVFLSFIVLFYSILTGNSSDFNFSLQAILVGFITSIPSLIVLEVAVFDYKKKSSMLSFVRYFSKKIILINLVYFLCSCLFFSTKQYFFPSSEEFFYLVLFYIITTIVGLTSLRFVSIKVS